jgi:hypothetical protein
MELEIIDGQSLKQASERLHDAIFEVDEIKVDAAKSVFSLMLWREVWEETSSERFLFFLRRWKAPHERCLLTFKHV